MPASKAQQKLSAQRKKKILVALKGGATRQDALRQASKPTKVSTSTFYAWLDNDPKFHAAVIEAENQAGNFRVPRAKDALLQCALKAVDDPRYQTSLIFYLKTHADMVEMQYRLMYQQKSEQAGENKAVIREYRYVTPADKENENGSGDIQFQPQLPPATR
jgi:hypothetical protein